MLALLLPFKSGLSGKAVTDVRSNITLRVSVLLVILIQITFFPFSSLVALPQLGSSIEVNGRVVDQATGTALKSVTVAVKGGGATVVTGEDGNFRISVSTSEAVLQVSHVNYVSQDVPVNGRSSIEISLAAQSSTLSDVVVVAYGTQKKSSVTGSVASISGKDLTNVPVPNISSALAGRLPGLVAVQRSGQPGVDNTAINIRGFGNALIIVDGVPQEFNQLDPNEIETFTILKDAAAAIYGARAANGVILVTTKRGKSGKPTISFSSGLSWQTRTNWSRMADAGEFTSLINQGRINNGQPLKYTEYDVKVFRYVSGDPNALNDMTDAEKTRLQSEDLRNYHNEDPFGAAFEDFAPMQQYNLSSRGGNESIKYFISGGFLNQSSMLRSGDMSYKRYNLRANVDARITKNLNVGVDFAGRSERRFYPISGIDWIMQLTYWGEPVKWKTWPDLSKPTGSIVDASNADLSGYQKLNYDEYNSAFNFDYTVPFVKGLSVQGRFNYRIGNYFNERFTKQYWTYNYDFKTDTYTRATTPSGNTSLSMETRQDTWLTGQMFLKYDRRFGKHDVKGLFLYEGLDNSLKYFNAYREGFLSTSLPILNAGGDVNKNNAGTEQEDGRASYAGRINYGYNDKYFLEATFRYDGNSMWAGDYRWGFFPGLLAAWRISEEGFFRKNISFIDNLKLRASIGISGDDAGGIPFQYLQTFSVNGQYILNNVIGNGIRNNGIANPYGTWAEYKTYNVGLDFSMFKNHLYGEIDVFYRDGYNLLGTRADALPTTFGAALPRENLNSSSNRGFELRLGYRNRKGDFSYNVEGNVSWNRAKWEQVSERDFSSASAAVKARDMVSYSWQNIMWGYKAVGLFQSQDEINKWPVNQDNANNRTLRPGDIKYLDLDSNGRLDRYDEAIIGNTVPLTMFGFNMSLGWKNFDFSMLIQGAANFNTHINEERAPAQFEGNTYAYVATNSWTPSNPNAKFPRFFAGGAQNNRALSSFWIHDASYVRLKNLQFGYTLPDKLLRRVGLSTCRFYFSGVNLLTLSDMENFDPEAPIGDIRYYPQQKTFSFGLNLNF
jgi:TonB-linked SusC/RagA family outer membrane protein